MNRFDIAAQLRRMADDLDGRDTVVLPAYELLHKIPGLPAGVVFVHDQSDSVKGSIGCGCLKLAWKSGDCQGGWCAETHILPGQLASDKKWFRRINNSGEYHLSGETTA